MTRQRRYQLKMKSQHCCIRCGTPVRVGVHCRRCQMFWNEIRHIRHTLSAFREIVSEDGNGLLPLATKIESALIGRLKARFSVRTKVKIYSSDKERRSHPLAIMRARLNSLLWHAIKRRKLSLSKCFSNLDYTPQDLLNHLEIQKKNGCAICKKPVEGKWQIAHRIPASYATNEADLLRLFSLQNLTVAHSVCNLGLGAVPIK